MRNIIAAVIFATFSGASHAYYEVRSDDAGASASEMDLTEYEVIADRRVQHLNHVGVPNPEVAAVSAGQSDGVALDTGLKMLLPNGWRAAVKPGINTGTEVRWNNGSAWPEALEQVARQQGLAITIHWQKKVVLINPMPAAASIQPPHAGLPRAAPAANYAQPAVATGLPSANMLPPPPTPQPAGKTYRDLQEFLSEEVRIDRVSVSLAEALQTIIPPNWMVDVRSDDPAISTLRFDLTFAGSRGAVINALGRDQNLQIIPYIEFSKLVVSRIN